MPRLTDFQRQLSVALLDQGLRPQDVANRIGCHVTTIRRLRRRVVDTGSTRDRPRSGRPRVTNNRQDRIIHRSHIRDRFRTAVDTARQTIGTHGREVSVYTIRRRLRERGLRARVPYRGPILDEAKRERRLRWARTHRRWTLARWRSVLFSDETRKLEDIMDDPEYADAAAVIIVTVSDAKPRSVRVNITVPEDMLRKIDSMAKKKGMSRSAFLVHAAQSAITPSSDSLSQQYFGGIV